MPLYVKMDQNTWVERDYTDSTSFDLSGTVYDENTFTTVRDLSSFTGVFRLIDQQGRTLFSSSDGLTLNADGTIQMTFSTNNQPQVRGSAKVRIELKISGSRLTAIGVNGSDEIFFEYD